MDDAIVEGIAVGAGIAGRAYALPRESVGLYNRAIKGEPEEAFEIYRRFLSLLRMDTVPNFVQLIELVQAEVGMGNWRVRAPRLQLVGETLERTKEAIMQALRDRRQAIVSQAVPATK
jgi:1-pyrroline-4-hydroxy-2-carboxylate deaminase